MTESTRTEPYGAVAALRGASGPLAVQGDELLVPLGYGEFVPGQITPHGPGTAGLLIWL